VEETRPSIVHLMNNGNFIDNYEGDGNSKKFDTIVEDLRKKVLMKDYGHVVTHLYDELVLFFLK
jgi:hypothetical protein